jgi:sulfite reductase beta subunit-like hemoprotein
MADESKESKVETAKRASRQLRGTIGETLASAATHFEQDDQHLLKFHGTYEQYDRDARRAEGAGREERAYAFMVRCKIPGGAVTADQYLALDAAADEWAGGALRITSREGMQFHGVLKEDLKATIRRVNETLLTTLGACGDVCRNVMACPAPSSDPAVAAARRLAAQIARELTPRTRAYHEIWLDGEKVETTEAEEPFYGAQYLPRKFKVAVALAQDNCVDVFSDDIGLVAVMRDGVLAGVNVLVGGGLGMTHGKGDTFARLATPLGYVEAGNAVAAVRTIAGMFRDYGNRAERRHARLKYVVAEWGMEKFRAEFVRRADFALHESVDTGPWRFHDHLGIHPQGDGRWFYGLFVESGRIKDTPARRTKSALRRIVAELRPGIVLTPTQNLLLTDLPREAIERVEEILDQYAVVRSARVSLARRYSMACPALPTCGLAISEAERVMPAVIDEFERELAELGLAGERISIRMTGCPNGCARPYTADIAFVGRSATTYDIFVGGRVEGDRLVERFAENVSMDKLLPALRPLLIHWACARETGEGLGDFYQRLYTDGSVRTVLTGACQTSAASQRCSARTASVRHPSKTGAMGGAPAAALVRDADVPR